MALVIINLNRPLNKCMINKIHRGLYVLKNEYFQHKLLSVFTLFEYGIVIFINYNFCLLIKQKNEKFDYIMIIMFCMNTL